VASEKGGVSSQLINSKSTCKNGDRSGIIFGGGDAVQTIEGLCKEGGPGLRV